MPRLVKMYKTQGNAVTIAKEFENNDGEKYLLVIPHSGKPFTITFAEIDERFGSFDNYLRMNGYQLVLTV